MCDNRWVNILFEEFFRAFQEFSCNNYCSGSSIADLIILGLCDFNHHLCSRVFDIHLFQDGYTIVGNDNITDGIDQHLVHAFWSECSPDCICNGLCCGDVHALCIAPASTGASFFKNKNWLSSKLCSHKISPRCRIRLFSGSI